MAAAEIGAAGSLVYLDITAASHNASGLFINCYDGAADAFLFLGVEQQITRRLMTTIEFDHVFLKDVGITWNMGVQFNMTQFFVPAIGILFFYIGTILKYTKRNWFVGIRTPWTLSSDVVWEKTHKLGGKLFKINRYR